MVEIKLANHEIFLAATGGIIRQVENMQKNRNAAHGAGHANDWQLSIEGCLGEYALAKHFGVYWSKGKLGDYDVGEVQVRTTAHETGRLILHKEDDDEQKFFLMIGVNGSYKIAGWITGKDGKQEEFWQDPTGKGRHAYFVPQNKLRPLDG